MRQGVGSLGFDIVGNHGSTGIEGLQSLAAGRGTQIEDDIGGLYLQEPYGQHGNVFLTRKEGMEGWWRMSGLVGVGSNGRASAEKAGQLLFDSLTSNPKGNREWLAETVQEIGGIGRVEYLTNVAFVKRRVVRTRSWRRRDLSS